MPTTVDGVYLGGGANTLTSNNIYSNHYGIELLNAPNCTLVADQIYANSYDGINPEWAVGPGCTNLAMISLSIYANSITGIGARPITGERLRFMQHRLYVFIGVCAGYGRCGDWV